MLPVPGIYARHDMRFLVNVPSGFEDIIFGHYIFKIPDITRKDSESLHFNWCHTTIRFARVNDVSWIKKRKTSLCNRDVFFKPMFVRIDQVILPEDYLDPDPTTRHYLGNNNFPGFNILFSKHLKVQWHFIARRIPQSY